MNNESNNLFDGFGGSDFVGGRRISKSFITLPTGSEVSTINAEDTKIFKTKAECYDYIIAAMDKYPTTRDFNFNSHVNYASGFNSWLMASGYDIISQTNKTLAKRADRSPTVGVTRYLRWDTCEGLIEYQVQTNGIILKETINRNCFEINRKIRQQVVLGCSKQSLQSTLTPRVQMENPEKLTEQGDMTQTSDKQQNTIITEDQQETVSLHHRALDEVKNISSSEAIHTFPTLTERWMPLGSFEISTADKYDKVLRSWYLPEDLYKETACSPSLIPFETFIYGRLHVELRIVVNANKFCCGKIVMSSKYDTYQADNLQLGTQSALNRNHVIIDLNSNNEGLLSVPFRYHRPYVRLLSKLSSPGVRPSKYCTIYVHVLSPLQTGPSGPANIGARLFYRLKSSEFAGMSYRVSVQMLSIESLMTNKTSRALKEVLGGAERAFDQLGKSSNQDKPGKVDGTIVVPRPRLNFCTGKGVSDTTPLRINPHTMTNYSKIDLPNDEPGSFYDIARTWGVMKSFQWKKDITEGVEILDFVLDPTLRSYTGDYSGEPTPLEYACANFCFWNGTVELRFDFVSNSFHTGTVQISAEFGRTTTSNNVCESSSTYVKNFHLGEQRSVSFRVPYIYDTLFRRTTANVVNPYNFSATSKDIKQAALTVAPLSKTHIKVKVINPLRPASTAPQTIEVLMFIRAGKNFSMHGLKSNSMLSWGGQEMNEFPWIYAPVDPPPPGVTSRRRRSVGDPRMNEWNEVDSRKLDNPVVQMDNGEKEDLDPTDNFNEGQCALPVQTLDCHMSFKDLLRRPCLLLDSVTIEAGDMRAYMIPIMPPQRGMSYYESSNTFAPNTIWANGIIHHTTTSITNLFRCWRGSCRYTIVVLPTNAIDAFSPVFVSYIPHTGVRCLGNHQILAGSSERMYSQAFVTEMIIPHVNNTATIEAPYETENTWTLMLEENLTRNFTWRDKGDTNSGHLAISALVKTKIMVFWSAGDDFELSNFYGMPKCKDNGWAYRYDDTHGTVQMDFQNNEGSTMVDSLSSVIKKMWSPKQAMRLGMACVPVIGTGLVAATAANDIDRGIEKVSSSADRITRVVEETADNFQVSMDAFRTILDQAVNTVASSLSGLVTGVGVIYDILLDVFTSWSTKSWVPLGVGIVRFIGKFVVSGASSTSMIMSYGLQLAEYIQRLVSSPTPVVQVEPDRVSTISGILLGLVGTLFGVHLDTRRTRSYMHSLGERFTSVTGVAYLVHVLRFVQSTFECIKNLIMEALGYVSPEAVALRMLSEKHEVLDAFISEAQLLTSEANSALVGLPSFRIRFWKAVINAYQIQKILCTVPGNVASGQLARLCNDVIKVANEKFCDMSSCPVRYEPFVVFIEGGSRVGKSHMSEDLCKALLDAIGYKIPASGLVYQRLAGEKFWSGYKDQPIVVYDEYLNSRDQQANYEFILEFQKLKSTGVFIPQMANLEEKKLHGNPLIILVLCNGAFPPLEDYATYPEAITQRREVVLHCARTPEFEGVDMRQITNEEIKLNKPHLRFRKYKNVNDSKSLSAIYKNYNETVAYLQQRFKNWHYREKQFVQDRMKRLPGFLTQAAGLTIRDPFSLFYEVDQHIQELPTQNSFTPFERLQAAVDQLSLKLDSYEQEQENTVEEIPDMPSWELITSPATQIDWHGVAATVGFSWALTPLKYFCKYATVALTRLEDSLNPLKTELYQCSICFEEVPCAYTCVNTATSEAKHPLCMDCWTGQMTIGDQNCPICRCDTLIPIIGREDMARLCLWRQLVIRGVQTTHWFVEKMRAYYQWRSDRFFQAYGLDFIVSLASVILSPDQTGCSFMSGLNTARLISGVWAATELMFNTSFQSDEWDDEEQPARVVMRSTLEDRFAPAINEQVLTEYQQGFEESNICMHDLLIQNMTTLRVLPDCFQVLDQSGRYLKVSFMQCGNRVCPFGNAEYQRRVFEAYLERQNFTLRALYLDFVNRPDDAHRECIPPIFRPAWMAPPEARISSDWWTYLSEKFAQYSRLLAYLTGVVTVVSGVVVLYRVMSNSLDVIQGDNGMTSSPSEHSPRHRRIELRSHRGRQYFQDAQDETPGLDEVVRGYVVRNTILITLPNGNKEKQMCGVGIFNQYVMIPRHYIRVLLEFITTGGQPYIQPILKPQLRVPLTLSVKDIVQAVDSDIAYFRVPASMPLFKDIRKFIAKEEDFDKPLSVDAELIVCPTRTVECFRSYLVEIAGLEASRVIVDTNEQTFEVKDVLVYNYSQPGACGSLLLRFNHQRPILSMHFAGSGLGTDGVGYGVLLTQEALAPLTTMNTVVTQFEDIVYGPIDDCQFVYEDDIALNYLGSVPKEEVPFVPCKSRLVKSLLYDKPGLSAEVAPAILSKNDNRYLHRDTPLYAGVKKHGQITKDFDREELDWACDALWSGMYMAMPSLVADPKVLSVEQAITGLDEDYYKGMDLSTSAGYPYILGTRKKKQEFIEVIKDDQLKTIGVKSLDPKVLSELERKRGLRKQGIVVQDLYIDTLKDEKRPIEKVKKLGGTRVFCNAPLDTIIEDRRFYMHFIASFMKHRFKLKHAVGINPMSSEWSLLTNKLLSKNQKFMTLDYSNFGPGYNVEVALRAYEILVRWTLLNVKAPSGYTQEEYERTLRSLVWSCIHSHHICSNTVYHQVAGSPSGAFFTTVVNSIVNQIYILIAFRRLTKDKVYNKGKSVWHEFCRVVMLFVYGDDVIMTVEDEYIDLFNTKTIIELFSKFGIAATNSDKNAAVKEWESIKDAIFLRRGFRRHDFRDEWQSPLVWASIVGATQWIWQGPSLKESTIVNASAAMLQAHGHGKQKFDELKQIINKALVKQKIQPISDDWGEIDELFYGGYFKNIEEYINF